MAWDPNDPDMADMDKQPACNPFDSSIPHLFLPTPSMASSSSNVVGVHYRVGKKIGEGSFGVIFEGTNLLNNQQVAIKFVSLELASF